MTEPFLIDFPLINTQKELDEIQGSYPQYSKEYVTSGCIKERRDWIKSMWSLCKENVEENFKIELATPGKFTQKTWELVIGTFIKKSNLEILRKTGEGPDFYINQSGKNVWIEATAPSIGDVDPAPERPDLKPGEIHTSGGDIET
ncbi:MAG: hypothetical protein PHH27_03085, partial [Candidatus Colwellbacteria bacterium]|nr:hypothetical protein [Candidatus Colwellbacteria bacterium]